jgi:hypothetical protein
MKEISEAEYNELRACHLMLSQIGSYVEDFCNEEDTTLQGVIRLLAEYHHMKSTELYEKLDSMEA